MQTPRFISPVGRQEAKESAQVPSSFGEGNARYLVRAFIHKRVSVFQDGMDMGAIVIRNSPGGRDAAELVACTAGRFSDAVETFRSAHYVPRPTGRS